MSKRITAIALAVLMFALALPANAAIQASSLEVRGTVWNETAVNGALTGATSWSPQSFAGFYYDVKDDLGRENMAILQTSPALASGQRTIDKDKLSYSTEAQQKELKVVTEAYSSNYTAAADGGLEQTASGKGFASGKYWLVGWQAEQYVALNAKVDKLAKLIIEQGTSASEKKTLQVGETWDIGGGWTLTANSIDAKATPRQVWLTLSKDGVKKDDKVVSSGSGGKPVFTYVEKSIAGETDVPMFTTYIDSVFAGATSDMVQLRYTWAVASAVTQVKSGDKFGVMEVVTVDNTGHKLGLNNTDSTISLTQDSTVDIMGNLKFKVADKSDVLRFYPKVDYEIAGGGATATATAGATGGATVTATPAGNATTAPTTGVTAVTTGGTPEKPPTPAGTATPKEPGFEVTLAVTGLLAVAFLVLRQRK